MVEDEQPGSEIPKDYRKVVNHQRKTFGWRYRKPRGGGYPFLYPSDPTYDPIQVPKTPSSGRRFKNFVAEIKGKGGQWPPKGE